MKHCWHLNHKQCVEKQQQQHVHIEPKKEKSCRIFFFSFNKSLTGEPTSLILIGISFTSSGIIWKEFKSLKKKETMNFFFQFVSQTTLNWNQIDAHNHCHHWKYWKRQTKNLNFFYKKRSAWEAKKKRETGLLKQKYCICFLVEIKLFTLLAWNEYPLNE